MDYSLVGLQEPDEAHPIEIWTGDPEAIDKMLKRISEFDDQRLLATWDTLIDYDPRNYYDKHGKIGMDTWADAIQSELSKRGLPIA